MKVIVNIVLCFLCIGLTVSSVDTYRAGTVNIRKTVNLDAYAALIREADRSNVDILVLPPPSVPDVRKSTTNLNDYDEVVKIISKAAKEHSVYVVSQVYETIRCQDTTELIRSNLVFNRQGAVISVYRKPLDTSANCNVTATEIGSFITDFGVTFGVLMPEDLVLQNLEGLKDVRNFVLVGNWETEIPELAAPQFFTSWAYTTSANLVSTAGIFAGKAGLSGSGSELVVTKLKNDGEGSIIAPIITVKSPYSEDLSQYIIKPLDLVASNQGVHETVCHGQFCCEFYVKTSFEGPQSSVSYGLAVFEGIRHYGGHHNIGTQHCALLPCVASYKRTCDIGSVNNTNLIFDEVKITGNFKLKNSAQYPIVLTTDSLLNNQFKFTKNCINKTTEATIKLNDAQKLLNFGIFGRDFSKDYESKVLPFDNTDGLSYKLSDYINSENVIEFFDYLWITFRVPIFLVSIYILEMM